MNTDNTKSGIGFKLILRIIIIVSFLILLTFYFINNGDDFKTLFNVNPALLLVVFISQFAVIISNVGLYNQILRIKNKEYKIEESIIVTIHSSVINFFGFLQAGLGYRGYYIHKAHNISYKFYTGITLFQLISMFVFSLLMGFIGYVLLNGLGLELAIILILFLLSVFILYIFREKIKALILNSRLEKLRHVTITVKEALVLLILVLFQFVSLAVAFGSQLVAVGANFSIGAVMIYTCIAVFSLVFAITPGAIGIRESMLLLVSSSMNLEVQDIVLSSTIDRTVYLILLLALLPFTMYWKKKSILKY